MSKLTDKIDAAEKAFAIAAGERALAVMKHGEESKEVNAAEHVRLVELREYNDLVNLKKSAEIAADGGEIEITVRGGIPLYYDKTKAVGIYNKFRGVYKLIDGHISEIIERQNETKGETENATEN